VVKAENFSVRLAGFWTQIVRRLPQPRAVSRGDAIAQTPWLPQGGFRLRWPPQSGSSGFRKRIQLGQVVIPQATDNASHFPRSRSKWIPSGFPGESACR
jgi:hypothetical protein